MEAENGQVVTRVSVSTILVNVLLSAFKLTAGIVAHSAAMVADAVHSIADLAGTAVVIVEAPGIVRSPRRERVEDVVEILLAALIFAVGAGIGYWGVTRALAERDVPLPTPGVLALAAAAVSIAVTEAMYWYTRAAAKKIGSQLLMADAWHHRFGAFSSVISFAGILGARLGAPVLDAVACAVIGLFTLKTALDIFLGAVSKTANRSCDSATAEKIRALIAGQEGVKSIDALQTSLFGNGLYIEAEIGVDGDLTLRESHEIARAARAAVETAVPAVKSCAVHVIPAETRRDGPVA